MCVGVDVCLCVCVFVSVLLSTEEPLKYLIFFPRSPYL